MNSKKSAKAKVKPTRPRELPNSFYDAACSLRAHGLVRQLRVLQDTLLEHRRRIAQLYPQHELAPIISSSPEGGNQPVRKVWFPPTTAWDALHQSLRLGDGLGL